MLSTEMAVGFHSQDAAVFLDEFGRDTTLSITTGKSRKNYVIICLTPGTYLTSDPNGIRTPVTPVTKEADSTDVFCWRHPSSKRWR